MTPAWSPSTTTRSPSRRPAPAGPRRRRARVPCRDADPDSRIHAPVTTAGIQGKQLKTEFRHVAARQLRSTSPVAHRAARPDSAEGSLPLIEYTASLAKELQFKVLWITTIWRWRRSLRAARTRTRRTCRCHRSHLGWSARHSEERHRHTAHSVSQAGSSDSGSGTS
jgi:hypothetical protein